MTPPMFALTDAGHAYPGRAPAPRGLTLDIAKGARVALLGANGSGKSTLLWMLAGLRDVTEGSVAYLGRPLTTAALAANPAFRRAFRTAVGVGFQDPDAQLFCPTVADEVAFGPLQLSDGTPAGDAIARAAATGAIARFDLAHLAAEPPFALSGGERRRVAMASILVMEPRVLLLDEPMAALDAPAADRLTDELAAWLAADPARTLIMATHDPTPAVDLCQEAILLSPTVPGAIARRPVADMLSDTTLLRDHGVLGRRA